MKTTIFILGLVLFLAGCSEKQNLDVQKKECLNKGKNFVTQKVLNHRTGQYVLKGECR